MSEAKGKPMDRIVVVNRSTVLTDDQVRAVIPALQAQVHEDFAPLWKIDAAVVFADAVGPGDWPIEILDTTDVPGAGGYHTDEQGRVSGKVFAGDAMNAGQAWTVDLSHELLEMLADPTAGTDMRAFIDLKDRFEGLQCLPEVCFAEGTEVTLGDGSLVRIEEVENGTYVKTFDGQQVIAAPAIVHCTGSAKTVRVRFCDGSSVVCTPDHLFLSRDGRWLPAVRLAGQQVSAAMFPRNPVSQGEHSIIGNSVFPRKRNSRFGDPLADCQNICLSETSGSDGFASQTAIASHVAFSRGVLRIVLGGTKEQMRRVAARRIIAVMADVLARKHRTAVEFIGQAMRQVQALGEPHLSIAGAGAGTLPYPTSVGFLHAAPKYVKQSGSRFVICREASEQRVAVSSPSTPMRDAKSASANGACTIRDAACLHGLMVDGVEENGNRVLYDMTVPQCRNFILGNGAVVHNCDAVEDDEFAYERDGVKLSDFVLPGYFYEGPFGKDAYDFKGFLLSPAPALIQGGYLGIYDPKTGEWSQVSDFSRLHLPRAQRSARRNLLNRT